MHAARPVCLTHRPHSGLAGKAGQHRHTAWHAWVQAGAVSCSPQIFQKRNMHHGGRWVPPGCRRACLQSGKQAVSSSSNGKRGGLVLRVSAKEWQVVAEKSAHMVPGDAWNIWSAKGCVQRDKFVHLSGVLLHRGTWPSLGAEGKLRSAAPPAPSHLQHPLCAPRSYVCL